MENHSEFMSPLLLSFFKKATFIRLQIKFSSHWKLEFQKTSHDIIKLVYVSNFKEIFAPLCIGRAGEGFACSTLNVQEASACELRR